MQKHLSVFIFPVITLVSGLNLKAQTLERQSISSAGSSAVEGNVLIRQTIGQPYNTTPYSSGSSRINPGFQQPVFSIESLKNDLSLKVFPNPATYSFTIESVSTLNSMQLNITDANGKQLENRKLGEQNVCSVDCSAWANGCYFITVRNEKQSYTARLIISR